MDKKTQAPKPEKIKDEVVKEVVSINHGKAGDAQQRPNLAVVQLGNDKDTDKFIEGLEEESKKVGVDTHVYKCPAESDEEEIGAMIDCLNNDKLMDGILVTLPLPEKFNPDEVLALVKAEKDLSYIMESSTGDLEFDEARIFKACLENFKAGQVEEL